MAETSNLVPNLEEIMEEYVQPEEAIRQEEPMEKMPTKAPEAPAVSEERTDKGKGKAREKKSKILCQKKLIPTERSTMPTRG